MYQDSRSTTLFQENATEIEGKDVQKEPKVLTCEES